MFSVSVHVDGKLVLLLIFVIILIAPQLSHVGVGVLTCYAIQALTATCTDKMHHSVHLSHMHHCVHLSHWFEVYFLPNIGYFSH